MKHHLHVGAGPAPVLLAALGGLLFVAGPAAAQVEHYGAGCPGASGTTPTLALDGVLQQGWPVTLIVQGTPLDNGLLAIGIVKLDPGLPLDAFTLPGCQLRLVPIMSAPFVTDAAGAAQLGFVAGPPAIPVHFQAWVLDSGFTTLGGMSDGMTVTILPDAPFGVGDLVVTEIHRAPAFTADAEGEWFEVRNVSAVPIDLEGFTISDKSGESHVVDAGGAGVVVAPAATIVLGAEDDPALNGGAPVGYELAGFTLDDLADAIVLTDVLGREIDRVAYGTGGDWPVLIEGRSLALSFDTTSAVDNDDPANWCVASASIGWSTANPDLASPGVANDACGCVGKDVPDLGYVDSNCDGIDGDIERAVFVATSGAAGSPGTIDQPLDDVQAAIELAFVDQTRDHVYVSEGTYHGTVTLRDGVSVFGGYSAAGGWARGPQFTTELRDAQASSGRLIGVDGSGLANGLTLGGLLITTDDASAAGVDTYGVRLSAAQGVAFEDVVVQPGRAGDGASGVQPPKAPNGLGGLDGQPGDCDDVHSVPGGAGGPGGCDSFYRGGNGGSGGQGDDDGNAGQTAPSGGSGGAGGAWSTTEGEDGKNGASGAVGAVGGNGAAAVSTVAISGGYWSHSGDGNPGGKGVHGKGGGGGGGGGGQFGVFVVDGTGNGGGGGGGGGCGGTGGPAGKRGGASIGVLLDASTASFAASTVLSGSAGNGGAGAAGGQGGSGGSGGSGGGTCSSQVGDGGDGGNAGGGGFGGKGSGAAGGYALGVLWNASSSFTIDGVTQIAAGTAGAGGTGPGAAGPAGIASDLLQL